MRCPNCEEWELFETDLFCSWCGFKVSDFELLLDVPYLYAGMAADPLTLTISHNGSVGSIMIDPPRVEPAYPWINLKNDSFAGTVLRSGHAIELTVEVDPKMLPDDYYEATIIVDSKIGPRSKKLEVVPPPRIQVITGQHELVLDRGEDKELKGHLELTRGMVTVANITTDVPWASVKLSGDLRYPIKLDARTSSRKLDFRFAINESMLINETEQMTPPFRHKGTLIIEYVELKFHQKETFHITSHLPPELIVAEESNGVVKLDLFEGRHAELRFTLQNGDGNRRGHSDLVVYGIEKDADWLREAEDTRFPISIPGGQSRQLAFNIVADDVGIGAHGATLTLITNLPADTSRKNIVVQVDVDEMKNFDGVLAIDFGTTNSCCSALDEDRLIMIPLNGAGLTQTPGSEEEPKQTTVPSVIVYYDKIELQKNKFEKIYGIGIGALQFSQLADSKPSTVSQIKRRLGEPEYKTVSYLNARAKRDNFLPAEITSDILRRILECAEDTLKRKIRKCVLSHPSRFSIHQISNLKSALVACGIQEKHISTIHEPVGAALSYIYKPDEDRKHNSYTLMVLDFGGGTTDITLMEVENESSTTSGAKINSVRPKVLGANGNSWFGGEDVTDMVMKVALRKCVDRLKKRYPDCKETLVPLKADEIKDIRHRHLAELNRVNLRVWAEQTKIALSNFGDDYDEATFRPPDIKGVIVDGVVKTDEKFDQREISPSVEEMNDEVEPKLLEIIEMMKRLGRNHNIDAPDVILLSGKSAALPVVEQLIRNHFYDSKITYPGDLKECVVQGACLWKAPDPSSDIDVLIDDMSALTATTSRIGLRVNEAGRMKFKEIIDAGVPIDGEGLTGIVNSIGRLRRHHRITIMENTGLDDFISEDNRSIRILATYSIEEKLEEWEAKSKSKVSDESLARAEIHYEITPNLEIKLSAKIPELDSPIEFTAESKGY